MYTIFSPFPPHSPKDLPDKIDKFRHCNETGGECCLNLCFDYPPVSNISDCHHHHSVVNCSKCQGHPRKQLHAKGGYIFIKN